MLERLSLKAQEAAESAVAEAARLGHGHVGTEHLLLGILATRDTAAGPALAAARVTLGACREKVAEAVAGNGAGGGGDLTDRARRALDRANRVSMRRREPTVSTAELAVSVLDVEGTAGQVLRGLGTDLATLRRALEAAGRDEDVRAAPAARRPSVPAAAGDPAGAPLAGDEFAPTVDGAPRCPTCSDPLAGRLAATVVEAHGPEPRRYILAYCESCGTTLHVSDA